jgi:hypothetical protein
MSNWYDFLITADQFFISYSICFIEEPLAQVKLFEIGHTIECYLKATYTKKTDDINKAIKLGHNIKKIWGSCKELDSAFMPNYEIKDSIYNRNFLKSYEIESLPFADIVHFSENNELYIISKHLPDLKYWGAPLKSVKEDGMYGFFVQSPNPYWITFLKELRNYLGYPLPNQYDGIMKCITQKSIPQTAIEYLSNLYK